MNSPFQDPDIEAIQRFKADVYILTKDRIKFTQEGDKNYHFSAILDSRFYQGKVSILEDAIRNKRQLWLIIEVRKVSTYSSISQQGFSTSGKILVLADAHYVNDTDEVEDINPSKR